jgi:hypothetical protein
MSENRHRRTTRLHAGLPENSRWRKENGPPKGGSFIWLTREMLESPAWRALSKPAQSIVFRIAIEHMSHAGTQNGDLPVTYRDFESYGVRRKSLPDALAQAQALGWIDIVERGRPAYADQRRPSKYGLTWLPRAAGSMSASNRWQRVRTQAEARTILNESNRKRKEERRKRKEYAERKMTLQFIATTDMERVKRKA